MKTHIKDLIEVIAIAIVLTIAMMTLFHFNFRFISGIVCFPTALCYVAIYGISHDIYSIYKDERDRARRDEKWRRERLVEDIMES
jgi:hypothetical protein